MHSCDKGYSLHIPENQHQYQQQYSPQQQQQYSLLPQYQQQLYHQQQHQHWPIKVEAKWPQNANGFHQYDHTQDGQLNGHLNGPTNGLKEERGEISCFVCHINLGVAGRSTVYDHYAVHFQAHTLMFSLVKVTLRSNLRNIQQFITKENLGITIQSFCTFYQGWT